MRTDPHGLAEERSLALHRVVAKRIAADPTIVERAVERVLAWQAGGVLHAEYADAWLRVLRGPRGELLRLLVEESQAADAMRQASPFTFVVPPRERWRLWREVLERWGAAGP